MTESPEIGSPRRVGTMDEAALARSVRQVTQPPIEKPAFWFLLRQFQRPLIGGPGVRRFPQPTTEIRPRGMAQVIVRQIAVREDGVGEA
jgi:hypothetical protein